MTIDLNNDLLLGVLSVTVNIAEAVIKGQITVEGDAPLATVFLASFDQPKIEPVLSVR